MQDDPEGRGPRAAITLAACGDDGTGPGTDVATVDVTAPSSTLTAVSNGDASITASAGGASGSVAISVEQVTSQLVFSSPPANNSVDVPFP